MDNKSCDDAAGAVADAGATEAAVAAGTTEAGAAATGAAGAGASAAGIAGGRFATTGAAGTAGGVATGRADACGATGNAGGTGGTARVSAEVVAVASGKVTAGSAAFSTAGFCVLTATASLLICCGA